jgi:hypothetical protein
VEIKQDEIKEVKKIGNLHGSEVKLVTLKGGFHIGMGKKSKKSNKSEILAVGSHPAIVSHQIEKQANGKFEQAMAKNEKDALPSIQEYSHNLSSSEKNVLGLDIYAMKKNEKVEFTVTKHNFGIFSIMATQNGSEIVLEKTEKNPERLKNIDKTQLSKNLEKSIKEYAKKNNLKVKKNW